MCLAPAESCHGALKLGNIGGCLGALGAQACFEGLREV